MLRDLPKSARRMWQALLADHDQIRRYHAKYHAETISRAQLPADLVRKVGLQMLAATRVMPALESASVPLLPQVASRLIRHFYGAEIHWKAVMEPGVAIVHGTGLVVSHAAKIGSGCILFQNVTLGESVDPETREVGAPTLGRDVHVGPGATLIGPIQVGDRSKIMAGAVLTQSVPPDSVVRPADSIVVSRRAASPAVKYDAARDS
jgi:serine O-acetyltransferase